jgi:uncharacterized OB-fold protein
LIEEIWRLEILAKEKKSEKMLEMLDERLIRGEISESTYKELKAKYSAKLEEPVEKANVCPSCGAELSPGTKFCASCGGKIGAVEKAAAAPAAPAAEKPAEKPAPKPGRTPWGECPICGGEWPPESDECKKCKATALASHQIHKNRSLLALGPRGKKPKGFAHAQYGAQRVAFLIDWLPASEFSGGANLVKKYKDGTNDHATFKLKTGEWDVHFHSGMTSPEKMLDFFAHPSKATAKAAPSKSAKPVGQYCPKCGTKIPEGAKFCPDCGAKA